MSSILTNTGAMVALQTMKGINSNMNQVQSEISTGKSVSSAKDNAAIWSISKTMESDVSSFDTIGENLSLGQSTVSVARQASETVTDLLTEMKTKIVAAQGKGEGEQKTLQTDIDALKEQIKSVVGAAQFNGVNLVNGDYGTTDTGETPVEAEPPVDGEPPADGDTPVDGGTPAAPGAAGKEPMKVLSSLDRSSDGKVEAKYITVKGQDLTLEGGLAGLEDLTVDDTSEAAEGDTAKNSESALAAIDALIKKATDAAASFGSAEKQLTMQSNFVSKLSDAVETGVGAMIDADMEEASARLQALQVQQQLSTQALSIANQAPQSILSLFR